MAYSASALFFSLEYLEKYSLASLYSSEASFCFWTWSRWSDFLGSFPFGFGGSSSIILLLSKLHYQQIKYKGVSISIKVLMRLVEQSSFQSQAFQLFCSLWVLSAIILMFLKPKKQKDLTFIKYKLRSIHDNANLSKKQKPKMTMDPQEENPIYSHLKQERNNRHVFEFLLNSAFEGPPKQRTYSEKFHKNKTYSPNFKAFSRHHRNHTCKEIQTLRMQGQSIFEEADNIGEYLREKKKKINILNQYNQAVDRYCKFIPKTYEPNEKQLLIAHEEVRKLCTENLFPKKDNLANRAASVKQYHEPSIPFRIFQRQKAHRRTRTVPVVQEQSSTLCLKNHTLHL